MPKRISSLQNKTVKNLLRLQEKSRNRRREKRFIVEGRREIDLALAAGYRLDQLYYVPEVIAKIDIARFLKTSVECIELSETAYKKMAYRNSTEGLLAVAHSKSHTLKSLVLPHNKKPFILVAEAPEKPGNIGALLRTADAANVDAVFIANPRTDLYNPNIIRSSVGCVFTNQVIIGKTTELIQFLQKKKINIFSATLQCSKPYTSQDYTKPTALVVGTEADGLSAEWRNKATQNILIPMEGKIDSMNVSVAAGILMFEVKRQRNRD